MTAARGCEFRSNAPPSWVDRKMPIAGDLLSAAPATRLIFRRGTWSLEIERLVAVDRDVYQARAQRLEGNELILHYLKRATVNPALASAAGALIRGLRPEQDCTFEPGDDEWVACHAGAQPRSVAPSAPRITGAHSAIAAELRAGICLLRATNRGLQERIARLEGQVVTQAREVRLAPVAAARAAPSLPAPLAETKLKFPAAAAINACLSTLIGKKIIVQELRAAAFPAFEEGNCWFSRLVDDEGREVGIIAADLPATVGLGGALLMLPQAALEAQRGARSPSADVLSAMDEVVNNLSATINRQPEGLHVRARPLEPMATGGLDWSKSAPRSAALQIAGDLGHLLLFARAEPLAT